MKAAVKPQLRAGLCFWHLGGVPAWAKANGYYEPGCTRCEEKRAKGIVTGSEPRPGELGTVRRNAATTNFFRRRHGLKPRRKEAR